MRNMLTFTNMHIPFPWNKKSEKNVSDFPRFFCLCLLFIVDDGKSDSLLFAFYRCFRKSAIRPFSLLFAFWLFLSSTNQTETLVFSPSPPVGTKKGVGAVFRISGDWVSDVSELRGSGYPQAPPPLPLLLLGWIFRGGVPPVTI